MNDTPTHPLISPWLENPPRGYHPALRHIKNIEQKVCMPWPRAARLRRKMIARGMILGIPRPLTKSSASWTEWESVLNGATSNMATAAGSTCSLPIYNAETGFHVANPDRNEFKDSPKLLRFLCSEGKMTKKDHARSALPGITP